MSDQPDPMVGAMVLGRYRIVARLAAGGMGVVYLARAEGAAGFAKPVVVKRMLPGLSGSEQMARLFIREAKILANLQHPNIVGVIDFGEEDGAYIMVLDYVRAYDVGVWAWFRKSKGEHIPIAGVVHIVTKVLDALEFAHTLALPDGTSLDIIHADISPSNVMVGSDGQVKLLDFGIARMRGEVTKSTDSNSIRGKFSYLPVEALDGSPPRVTTDVYACGVTLYELLAGNNPFTVDDDTVTLARVISHDPPPVSELREGVSPELDAIVARAMARDRTKRYQSAKEFARDLRRVLPILEDEAVTNLAALAKHDYAQMPEMAGYSLAELDAAWRAAPDAPETIKFKSERIAIRPREEVSKTALALAPTVPPAKAAPESSSGPATLASPEAATGVAAKTAAMESAPTEKSGSGKIALVAVASLVLAASVTGVVLYLRRPEPEEPKIVLVERTGPTIATPDPASSPAVKAGVTASAVPSSASAEPKPTETAAPKSTKPAAGGNPLSAAFAKNQPAIEACFKQEASNLDGTPEIAIRFSIDTEGSVQKAELLPPELSGVPLGQCILGVARKTKFPAQAAPTTFRIPITARRTQ